MLTWQLVDRLLEEQERGLRDALDLEYGLRYGELVRNSRWAVYESLGRELDSRSTERVAQPAPRPTP